MTRVLLALICGFAAVSSTLAANLGFQTERVVAFSALVGALCAGPYLRGARLPQLPGLVVCLFLLLLAIAVQDALLGKLDPVDYKVVLPLLVLLSAPALARELEGEDLVRFAWRLLAFYVLGTFAYELMAEPAAVSHGYAGIVRYDPTGSVIMHASLSLICLLLALARLPEPAPLHRRCGLLLIGGVALVMVLEAATRTVIVTLVLLACFHLLTTADRRGALGRLLAVACGLVLVFAAYSELWNPSFLLRLVSNDEVADYGSGRLPSIAYWLALAGDHPFGLGFGAVREMLADGKPSLDGDSTLEWPHDEYVRFYVEAGPVGLAFVLLLVGLCVWMALRTAAADRQAPRRTLTLAIAADLVAESCLQNLFNAIYHATVLVTFLALAAESARREAEAPCAEALAAQA
jgi:O-antigen ligase